jgi:hypothetical protein
MEITTSNNAIVLLVLAWILIPAALWILISKA